MKNKKFLIVDLPVDEKDEKINKRLDKICYVFEHYKRNRWFRLHKDIPVEQDIIFGPGLKWDYVTGKLKPDTQEDKSKAQQAERILFQLLRTEDKLKSFS